MVMIFLVGLSGNSLVEMGGCSIFHLITSVAGLEECAFLSSFLKINLISIMQFCIVVGVTVIIIVKNLLN